MNRPLNFLHLTTFYPPYGFGGDAMHVYRLARALGERGHRVDVVHCIDSYHLLHPGEPESAFPTHPNVAAHGLRSGLGWLSPLLSHQTGRPYLKGAAIRRLLAARRYDVIHFHNISLMGPAVMAVGGAAAVKIYTAHEHWLVCPTHVMWKFNRRVCESPHCLRCVIGAKRPPQAWRYTGLLGRSARHVDAFAAPSRFTARLHAERGFPYPLVHLPQFADRADRDWQEPGAPPHPRPFFLFVGRLEVIKGLHTLIQAWDGIGEADLLVAGAGSQEARLRALAAANPRIRFLGHLAQDRLGRLYAYCLACIVPSLTYETFATVIVEAFARKAPVIVRELGALPEIVGESGGGLIYRSDEELTGAIQRLARERPLRDALGERGYAAFERRWSKEAHLEMYFELLQSVARRKFGCVPWEG